MFAQPANATPCNGPICCDRDPVSVLNAYIEHTQEALMQVATRTGEVAGKYKCTALLVVGICSDESLSVPGTAHAHRSPCDQLPFTRGPPDLPECPPEHLIRHEFDLRSHFHYCIDIRHR